MRIVALEEHLHGSRSGRPDRSGRRPPPRAFPGPDVVWGQQIKRNELADLGAPRIADMDASGITVQVLSVSGPGADVVHGGQAGITMARAYNDALAEGVARHPDRLRRLRSFADAGARGGGRTNWNAPSGTLAFTACW